MKKKAFSLMLAVLMLVGLLAGCGGNQPVTEATENTPAGDNTAPAAQSAEVPADVDVKESPMLQEMAAAGKIPALADRLPSESDVYVETEYMPEETPSYGNTLRVPNGGKWDWGSLMEEGLFRLLDDGTVEPNVAKGYDLSDDGLTYTIHLREGMRWSDGTPFTATDCVYYYNYVLVPEVNNETGEVTKSYTTKYYNWYKTEDPADGILKPAQVRYVDDTTFTITLYSPKPTLLQAIAIDNKWMFCPKEWYKDIVAVDMDAPHWTGETDLKKIGGEGLVTVTESQALENAKAKSSMYTFEDYSMLCKELNYYYWQYAGRPTLRAWTIQSPLTETTLVWERNPYYWKVDADGRQLPYIDKMTFTTMDESLIAQEIMAGNIDYSGFNVSDYSMYKASSIGGCYNVKTSVGVNWSAATLELNQTYKDPQYAQLFSQIDFRHALSIGVDRSEMNEILFDGLAEPTQFAAPEGTAEYIEGGPTKWIEYDVDGANALLDGIDMISSDLDASGYRTFVDGDNAGKPITLIVETTGDDNSAKAVALLAQFYKKLGIQVVESANTDNNARNEKYYQGNEAMCAWGSGTGIVNVMLRPDYVALNRNNVCWAGLYGMEHQNNITPEAGTPMAELLDATKAMVSATTLAELQKAAMDIVENHYENTWIIGFLNVNDSYHAVNNRVCNWREGFVICDELRFLGNARPYSWYIAA